MASTVPSISLHVITKRDIGHKKCCYAVGCSASADRDVSRPTLAQMWRELQGTENWRGLVSPLHPLLREEIVRYGELANTCYKAFDLDPASRGYLAGCKYGRRSILAATGVDLAGLYEVTKYIYANPGVSLPPAPCRHRWMGFVAVSRDGAVRRVGRRDIVAAFRGTVTAEEWLANLTSSLAPAGLDPWDPRPEVMVKRGFLDTYTSGDPGERFSEGSCREQLLREVTRLVRLHQREEEAMSITLTGHSMGSSLAILAGYDLAELGLNVDGGGRRVPVAVYSFAGPRVGNVAFKERCEELGVRVLRVANVKDPVTKLLGVLLNEGFRVLAERYELPWNAASACYAHIGVELALEFFRMWSPVSVHDMDDYLEFMRSSAEAEQKVATDAEDEEEEEKELIEKVRDIIVGMGAWAQQ